MQKELLMVAKKCSTCSTPIEGPDGLCPSCLMQQGLAEDTVVREDAWSPDDSLRQALEGKLGGQYRILRLLGRGGMGAVYLARDLTLEREVAIKVVKPASDAANLYDRFRREAKTAAQLSHPNVVPLHAFGDVEGMPYFVMGYVRGESLTDRLRREGRIPENEARRILAEIADALDHAHRRGVVHRDVKPDNVLLEDASGRALLTDFGIAKTMAHGETLTQHGSVVGTPHYMSPEQAAGRADIDARSDIYSLGVMGYAMLAGRLPFEGKSAADVLSKHLTQEPPPLRSLAPTISESTLQVIERCLAKDPAKRWQDCRSLRSTLGVTEDSELPDALEAVHGQGMAFLLISMALFLLARGVVVGLQGAPRAILGIVAAGVAMAYVAVVAALRFEGYPIGLVQRVIWSEPSWWPFWYPRKVRRRNNVWDRLPRAVRLLRTLIPLMFIMFALTAPDTTANFTRKLPLLIAFLAAVFVLEVRAKAQLKRMGITSRNDLNRIAASAPLSRARFWNQPRIAAILAPAPAEPVQGDSPHAQLQSILRIADELSPPLRPLGVDAAAAARRLLASIDESEKQIADLARHVEAGEEERLVGKIDGLAGMPEAAEMRELLEKQLELVRSLSARIEIARAHRSRRMEMLKTLALHMASLRARVSDAPAQLNSVTDNVRALCDQIGHTAVD